MYLFKVKVYVNFLNLKCYINECYLNKGKGILLVYLIMMLGGEYRVYKEFLICRYGLMVRSLRYVYFWMFFVYFFFW